MTDRIEPARGECKTRHVHIMLTPTNYQRIRELAESAGISFNEQINRTIEQVKE